jgi:hypothetical protein
MNTKLTLKLSTLVLALFGAAGLLAPAATAFAQENKDTPKAEEAKKDDGKKKDPDLAISVNPESPDAKKVYIIPIRGEFGENFSANALRDVLKDAKTVQPDIIIVRIDATFTGVRGGPGDINSPRDNMNAFDSGQDNARAIGIMLTDDIKNDPAWTTKPRVICWVKKALGQTAFLPFAIPEVYFTSDGIHGGIGYLDLMFAGGRGDHVVWEKQRSLRLKRAMGMAVKGGHEEKLVEAMCRRDYSLSYTLVGGKPVYYENIVEGENILTDDGDPEKGHADSLEDVAAYRGNDVLTLHADIAKRIGFSEGTADTLEELAYELGVSRAYRVFAKKPAAILKEFNVLIGRIGTQYEKLRTDFRQEFPRREEGQTADERNQRRSKCKRYLTDMIALIERYPEMMHARGDPEEETIAEYKQIMAQIDQEIRLDKPGANPRRR